jgi:signal transduction histidine kinase
MATKVNRARAATSFVPPSAALALPLIPIASLALLAGRSDGLLAISFAAAVAISVFFPLPAFFKTDVMLDTIPILAAILVLPPGLAVWAVGAGALAGYGLRRRHTLETVFNSCLVTAQGVVGATLVIALGLDPDRFDEPLQLGAAFAVGLALVVVADLGVAGVVTWQGGLRLGQQLARGLIGTPAERMNQLAQVGLGVLVASWLGRTPWMLPLLLLPIVAIYLALAYAIHTRKQAALMGADAEAIWQEAQKVATIGSWSWDLATGDVTWSREAQQILAWSNEIPPSWTDFVDKVCPADRARIESAVHAAVRQGERLSFACLIDGASARRYIRVEGGLVMARDGTKLRLVGVVRDATAERESELARDTMLAAISHDLRTPLTVVAGNAQLLRRRNGDDPLLAERVRRIEEAVTQALAQTTELVDVAQAQAGRPIVLSLEPYDLAQLVWERITAHQAASSHCTIVANTPNAPLELPLDRLRLSRVLDNLIGNAVKYSPDGGQVSVCLERVGQEAVLSVRDHGIGIPAPDLPYVFEPFRRGSNVADKLGTGLGLAGAKQAIAAHGGEVAVRSTEGQGSTFVVRLPLMGSPASPIHA